VLRDGDGGLERFLGSRRIGWVTLQQHFAADAMQFGVEAAFGPPGRGQRFVEDRDSAVDVACTGFGLGKGNLLEFVEGQDVLLAHKFDAATHGLEPAAERAALGRRQALEKDPIRRGRFLVCYRCQRRQHLMAKVRGPAMDRQASQSQNASIPRERHTRWEVTATATS
jgi:hypothetical protein